MMAVKTGHEILTMVLGAAFTTALAAPASAAVSDNPFVMTQLETGYMQLAENSAGTGQASASTGDMEKGVQGMCGMRRMDADGDGKVTREEFMQGHELIFTELDTNGDGVLDADERHAHMMYRKGKKGGCLQRKGMSGGDQ